MNTLVNFGRENPRLAGQFWTRANSTWSQLASLPSNYEPLFFASAILPDGRAIVAGGEYNFADPIVTQDFTGMGAIYSPYNNTWTSVTPPLAWGNQIGDSQSVVLPDGSFMIANISSYIGVAILNSTTSPPSWTNFSALNKVDQNDEEGWTLLPNGKVLTVDVYNPLGSEVYTPSSKTWASATADPNGVAARAAARRVRCVERCKARGLSIDRNSRNELR